MNLTAIRERLAVGVVRLLPEALYSGVVGWSARRTLPKPLRTLLYSGFARMVGARLDEVELPLADYPSFGTFFARRLRPETRTVDAEPGAVIAPCDGVVAAVGTAREDALVQAKGRSYSLAALVADDSLAARLRGGTYLTIYLSPKDYHRVHAPVAGTLKSARWIPGSLMPVNPLVADHIDDLFARNERVVLEFCDSEVGEYALVMVAASGVGNLWLAHSDQQTARLRRARLVADVGPSAAVSVAAGDELGAFYLGSTVVVVFAPGRVDLDTLAPGAIVQFGQRIAAAIGDYGTKADG